MDLSDPACPVCSKPIRSGTLVVFEHGALFHVGCRSRTLALKALEQADRSRRAQARAAEAVALARALGARGGRGGTPRGPGPAP